MDIDSSVSELYISVPLLVISFFAVFYLYFSEALGTQSYLILMIPPLVIGVVLTIHFLPTNKIKKVKLSELALILFLYLFLCIVFYFAAMVEIAEVSAP